MSVIDHLGVQVADYQRALRFYRSALAPLGISIVMQVTKEETGSYEGAGLGRDGKPDFWLSAGRADRDTAPYRFRRRQSHRGRSFFRGGACGRWRRQRRPGIRAHYHPNYYGAFVLDPEGHNIEAVCHKPE